MTIDKLESLPIREVSLANDRYKPEMRRFLSNLTAVQIKTIALPLVGSLGKYQYRSVGKPNAAEPKAIQKIRNGAKSKESYVDFLLIFFSPSNFGYLWQTMSAPMQKLLEALAEKHYLTEEEAVKLYGKKIIVRSSYWRSEIAEELEPWLHCSRDFVMSDYGYAQEECLFSFEYAALYSVFFAWQCLQQEKEKPSLAGLQTYNGEKAIFHDYPFVASLFESGQLKVGSTKLRTKSFEKAVEKLNLEDFHIQSSNEWMSYCSRQYFVPMLYALFADEWDMAGSDVQEQIKDILKAEEEYEDDFYKLFVPHIKGIKSNYVSYACIYYFLHNISNVLTEYPFDEWTSVEQFIRLMRAYKDEKNNCGEIVYQLFDRYNFARIKLENGYIGGHWISFKTQMSELSDVVAKSILFALASWGVLEIAYLPEMPKDAVSPFDALKYVRLTKFGRYVYEHDEEYMSPMAQEDANSFELSEDRLLIKVNNLESPRIFVLERFAQSVAPTLYKVEASYFMKDCSTKVELEEKINLFKRNFGKNLPQVWNDFFEDLLMRCEAFAKAGKAYTIRRINKKDKRLQEIILTDERLKSYILRAEGYLILIEQKHLPEVIKIMQEYGYMM